MGGREIDSSGIPDGRSFEKLPNLAGGLAPYEFLLGRGTVKLNACLLLTTYSHLPIYPQPNANI